MHQQQAPHRYRLLDGLRALAALSVVVWHYQHFFVLPSPGTALTAQMPDSQPFFALLAPAYRHGAQAVDFFFVLSGFIFFALYRERIETGETRAAEFWWHRFSRLYPLHFVTWCGVAGLQFLYQDRTGQSFVFQNNGLGAWLLGLIMVVGWQPFESAFNAPAWSISLELILYFAFFSLSRARATGPLFTAMFVAGFSVAAWWLPKLGGGLAAFFIGGLCFFAVSRIHRASRNQRRLGLIGSACVVLGAVALLLSAAPVVQILASPARSLGGLLGREVSGQSLWNRGSAFAVTYCLFPGLVVFGALAEEKIASWRLPWLGHFGDTTYSAYLLHFPLQLVLVLAVDALALPRTVFLSQSVFCCFFALLLGTSWLSFHFFERPAQQRLRRLVQQRSP